MAEQKEKKNRLVEVFTKDYKYEGLILLILAIIALVLGILVEVNIQAGGTASDPGLCIPEAKTITDGVFLISYFRELFAWILIVLGAFSIILSVWPYYKPSVYEIKRITWPNQKTMLENTVCTFIFVLIFVAFFTLVDSGLSPLVQWIISWSK